MNKTFSILLGGVVSGLFIILGELPLNLWLLAEDWHALFTQFGLAEPSAMVALQGVVKLLLLGIISTALAFNLRIENTESPWFGIKTGLLIWFLIWAWVQWGMLLAGYVSFKVALYTTLWGFVELPIAVYLGTKVALFFYPPCQKGLKQ